MTDFFTFFFVVHSCLNLSAKVSAFWWNHAAVLNILPLSDRFLL
jgi:hypothetical protein